MAVQALLRRIAGEQVYRDPSVWDPPNVRGPLTQDARYREAMALAHWLDDPN